MYLLRVRVYRALIGACIPPAGVSNSRPQASLATAELAAAVAAGPRVVKDGHMGWWRAYWGRSMLSVPDPVVEAFHSIQLYKVRVTVL